MLAVTDGDRDGKMLGIEDDVGTTLGSDDGTSLGTIEGEPDDGFALGSTEGTNEGDSLGTSEGVVEG